MPNAFTVERTEQGSVVLLALDGYLDAHTAPQFEKAIEREYNYALLFGTFYGKCVRHDF